MNGDREIALGNPYWLLALFLFILSAFIGALCCCIYVCWIFCGHDEQEEPVEIYDKRKEMNKNKHLINQSAKARKRQR